MRRPRARKPVEKSERKARFSRIDDDGSSWKRAHRGKSRSLKPDSLERFGNRY